MLTYKDPKNIKYTDKFLNKLDESGYNIVYNRISDGGHGNFSVKDIIHNWLKKQFEL